MLPNVKNMTKEEKLLTMRNSWEDMRQELEGSPETPEIIDLLDQRIARVESGEAELLDWDKVKGSIGRSPTEGVKAMVRLESPAICPTMRIGPMDSS